VADYAVCVIGAGPAGLVVAQLLQQAGVSCVVLERQAADELRTRARAGFIEHRSVELLKPYGLERPILERGATNGVIEFRADGEAFVLDYRALAGGRGHYVYPQPELVGDWADDFVAAGGELRFGVQATGVERTDSIAVVTGVDSRTGSVVRVSCEAVAACDGSVAAFAGSGTESVELPLPYRWLCVMAATPPVGERTIYGLHPHGYSGHMRRSPTTTRYYLEVPRADTHGDWPDERVRDELGVRLGDEVGASVSGAEFVERDFLDLRVRVAQPMQAGRVFLAGDAAHLITPAAGKGMNLAIQDALELGAGLAERFGAGSNGARLAAYSATRLPTVWRYQEFSHWVLNLLHAGPVGEGSEAGFLYRLRRARLDRLFADPPFARWFAHQYAGVDATQSPTTEEPDVD
jgi:p-hydroxybenzoate 3-monooxygenase